MTRIYTRSGDAGTTGLVGGARVAKDDARVEALGAVDEANAALGLARLDSKGLPAVDAMLARIQHELFDLGADLATPDAGDGRIRPSQAARLEAEIDAMTAQLPPLTAFVLPGGSPAAAHLHLARTVLRRAERCAVALQRLQPVTPAALTYLNRLSDHLFVAARLANADTGGDVLWRPGGAGDGAEDDAEDGASPLD